MRKLSHSTGTLVSRCKDCSCARSVCFPWINGSSVQCTYYACRQLSWKCSSSILVIFRAIANSQQCRFTYCFHRSHLCSILVGWWWSITELMLLQMHSRCHLSLPLCDWQHLSEVSSEIMFVPSNGCSFCIMSLNSSSRVSNFLGIIDASSQIITLISAISFCCLFMLEAFK